MGWPRFTFQLHHLSFPLEGLNSRHTELPLRKKGEEGIALWHPLRQQWAFSWGQKRDVSGSHQPQPWGEMNSFHAGASGKTGPSGKVFTSSRKPDHRQIVGQFACWIPGAHSQQSEGSIGQEKSGPFFRTTNQYKAIWVKNVERSGEGLSINSYQMIFISLRPRKCLINVCWAVYFCYFFTPLY